MIFSDCDSWCQARDVWVSSVYSLQEKLQYDYSKCIKIELHKRATLSRDYKPRKSIATILQYVPTELNINNAAVRLLYIL